jgi:hypothetical protein
LAGGRRGLEKLSSALDTMSERPKPTPEPEQLLSLKEAIQDHWDQLPAEHQALMAMVLVGKVMEGEGGAWLREAIELRWPREQEISPESFPVTSISRADLERVDLSPEQAAQLTDDDMRGIAGAMEHYYRLGAFWLDLERVAHEAWEQKRYDTPRADALPPTEGSNDTGRIFTVTSISRADLERASLSEEQISQLTDEDLERIAQQIEDHLVNDVFWDELEYAVLEVMAQKVLSERRGDSQSESDS